MSLINEHTTIPKLLRNVIQHVHPENHTFLKHKVGANWEEISFKKVLDTADAISSYLLDIGIKKETVWR